MKTIRIIWWAIWQKDTLWATGITCVISFAAALGLSSLGTTLEPETTQKYPEGFIFGVPPIMGITVWIALAVQDLNSLVPPLWGRGRR